ncbi:SCO1664 family protein [soil metagenome]
MARIAPTELELISVDGLLAGASNATLLARDADGNPWVYKPEQGERPLWDFAHGSLAWREVACYRLSEALNLAAVPETLLARGPYGIGSAQRYLEEDFAWDPRQEIVNASPALWPIVVLDLIANNADRKIGHLLREPGKDRLWAIDNGLTFHTDAKLRTVLWSFAGQPLPDDMVARLKADVVARCLEGLLGTDEINSAAARVTELKKDPIHPGPPLDRPPMPWPIW